MTRDWVAAARLTQNFPSRLLARDKSKKFALARHNRLSFGARFRHHFVSLRHPNHFLDSGAALRYAAPAVLPQRFHPLRNSALLQLAPIALLHDHFAQWLGHDADFVNRGATLVTGLPALIATFAAHEFRSQFFQWESDFAEIFSRILDFLGALRANGADEPLRNE